MRWTTTHFHEDFTMHDPARDLSVQLPIDPVCGMSVDPAEKSELHLDYDGRTFWFCGKGCLLEFRDAPGQYLDPNYNPQGM